MTLSPASSRGSVSGALLAVRVFAAGTVAWTPTVGTTRVYVECQAGGGGGGGVAGAGTGSGVGGGGGGGGYAASWITSVQSGAHVIAVGAAGSGGAGSGAGTAGGDTSLTLLGGEAGTAPLAKGGAVGTSTTASTVAALIAGGNGGGAAGQTGDLTAWGGDGQWGGQNNNGQIPAAGVLGMGGGSAFAGVNRAPFAADGNVGHTGGGGGSGAFATTVTKNGAAGAAGFLRVWEFS